MSEFEINTDVINGAAEGFNGDYRDLNNANFQILCVRCRLFGATMIPIRAHLAKLETQLLLRSRRVYRMSKKLNEISRRYENADNNAAQHTTTGSSPAFDDDGQYGGDQGSPRNHYDEMEAIVRKYHPDWSEGQIRQLLNNINSEGCGFVAMLNTIFLYYNGREEEFEKTFGFPMYKNGDLNYDELLTDFYCAEDDPGDVDGTTRGERERYWEHYCKEHGVDVDVRDVKVTADNYNELSKKGQIVVAIRPNYLYDKDGNQVDRRDSGHAMTVTGVTEDGRLIVSSWGETYYLNSDLSVYSGFLEFQQVCYGK